MNRRQFLLSSSAAALATAPLGTAMAQAAALSATANRLVVMVYLKGGNDGYNTLVPVTNEHYYKMRPTIALQRDQVMMLNASHGLNRSLEPLMTLWANNELAILQGIGQQDVTNQHYRDAETQFTGSAPDEFLTEGWMTRALKRNPSILRADLDALAFGDLDIREADPMGSFRGGGQRVGVVNMLYPSEWHARRRVSETAFLSTAKAARIAQSFALEAAQPLKTVFPGDAFGNALQATVELAAAGLVPPVVHITLNAEDGDQHNAFDTHWTQQKFHGTVLQRLAEGLAAFRAGMQEIGQLTRWFSPKTNSVAARKRMPKAVPTTAGRACISRSVDALTAASTARRCRWSMCSKSTARRRSSITARCIRQ